MQYREAVQWNAGPEIQRWAYPVNEIGSDGPDWEHQFSGNEPWNVLLRRAVDLSVTL